MTAECLIFCPQIDLKYAVNREQLGLIHAL